MKRYTRAGKATTIDGREVKFSVDHWVLTFSFTPSKTGVPFQTVMLPQPSPVSNDIAARGYFEYEDDGAVYCITVESDEEGTNSNFLTQRLSLHTAPQKSGKAKRANGPRTEGDGLNVTAHAVFVGNCLDDLRKRYLRSAESINTRAKEQLQLMCRKFDLLQCTNVVESLISLGETKVLTDLLRKHFPLVIDDLSITSLLPYLDHDRIASMDDGTDIRKRRFKELASLLDMSRFGACMLTLLSNFTDVLSSCARMEAYLEGIVEGGKESESVLSSIRSAKDFLSLTRNDLWQQVQQHVTVLLTSVFLTTQTIDIDDFLRILHTGFAFITVGETFSRSNSDALRGQLYKKAKEYVRHFARETFDGVRTALEKEEWKPLKTSKGFTMYDLLELSHREKRIGPPVKDTEERKEPTDTTTTPQLVEDGRTPPLDSLEGEDVVAGGMYEAFLRGDNPFRPTLQAQLAEYDRRHEEKRMERERGRYYRLQSGTEFKPTSKLLNTRSMQNSLQHASLLTSHTNADIGAILTASSLVTVKFVGRYISVMEDIKPLAMESFSYMQEVFDLYVYAIFCMFGPKQSEFFTDYFPLYPALKKLVQSVKTRVEQGTFGAGMFISFAIPRTTVAADVASPQGVTGTQGGGGGKKEDKTLFGKLGKTLNSNVSQVMGGMTSIGGGGSAKSTPAPVHREEKRGHPILVPLCDSVNQDDERRMYAVTERCIAIESIPFLLQVIESNLPRMLKALKPSEQLTVHQWTASAASVITDLQAYMYRNLAPVMLPDAVFSPKIRNMDWMIKAPASTASPYVFSILTTLRANTLCMKDNGGLPAEVQRRLNEEVVSWLIESLIAAYGEVKRCSDEGRGLMKLDSEVLEGALKGLLRMEELKGWKAVTVYVDAYWVKAEDWVQWVRDHREYSLSVIVTAIQCGAAAGMEKKEQKELLLSVSREWQRLTEEEETRKDEEKAKAREERKE